MPTEPSPRAQAALEQISEDESLVADVTNTTATTITNWLSEHIVAADTGDDAQFEQAFAHLRDIARTAAQKSHDDPAAFTAAADALLAPSAPPRSLTRVYDLALAPQPPTPDPAPAIAPIASTRTGPGRRAKRRAKGKR